MARLRLFAQARESAGRRDDHIDAPTLGRLLELAAERYGEGFVSVLEVSKVWVNGEEPPEGTATHLGERDEVAVLPPVSGGTEAPRNDASPSPKVRGLCTHHEMTPGATW